jgi:hypothetical protein
VSGVSAGFFDSAGVEGRALEDEDVEAASNGAAIASWLTLALDIRSLTFVA